MSNVKTGLDSAGWPISIGSKVRFRGELYTIKAFIPGKGRYGSNQLAFEELVHVAETPDEIAVDLVELVPGERLPCCGSLLQNGCCCPPPDDDCPHL